MKITLLFLTVVALPAVFGIAEPAHAKAKLDPKAAFERGSQLMAERQFKAAIPLLKQAEKAFPQEAAVLWNLGLASAEVGKPVDALGYWQKYRKAHPDDWKSLPKIIQAHQARGDVAARDREIAALYQLRAQAPQSELGQAKRFCREQFQVGATPVLAFETFAPQAPEAVFYQFAVVDPQNGRETSFISLGSYDAINEVAQRLGEIPPGGRLYHLDRYADNQHQAFLRFGEKPAYEIVRKAAVAVIQGKMRPLLAAPAGR